jgi:hypothetical protein
MYLDVVVSGNAGVLSRRKAGTGVGGVLVADNEGGAGLAGFYLSSVDSLSAAVELSSDDEVDGADDASVGSAGLMLPLPESQMPIPHGFEAGTRADLHEMNKWRGRAQINAVETVELGPALYQRRLLTDHGDGEAVADMSANALKTPESAVAAAMVPVGLGQLSHAFDEFGDGGQSEESGNSGGVVERHLAREGAVVLTPELLATLPPPPILNRGGIITSDDINAGMIMRSSSSTQTRVPGMSRSREIRSGTGAAGSSSKSSGTKGSDARRRSSRGSRTIISSSSSSGIQSMSGQSGRRWLGTPSAGAGRSDMVGGWAGRTRNQGSASTVGMWESMARKCVTTHKSSSCSRRRIREI